jgi:cytoskeletal protein CcmA (bactofilin family)
MPGSLALPGYDHPREILNEQSLQQCDRTRLNPRPDVVFQGRFDAEEDLLIQGRVEGSITHTQRLTVGPQGTVKANIRAQLIIVEGTVDGDLQAEKSVFVKETAKVCGNIFAPTVSIMEGANFSGSIDMDGKKAGQLSAKQDAATPRPVKVSGGAG